MYRPDALEVALPSLLRTAEAIKEWDRDGWRGITAIIKVTIDAESAILTPHIEGYDQASAGWITILTGAAIAATGTTILTVNEHATVTANLSARKRLPRRFRFRMAVADTDDMTYSVGAWLEA